MMETSEISRSAIQLSRGHTETHLIHRLVTGPLDAEVDHGVGERPSHVELQGEVVQSLGVRLIVVLLGPDPPGDHVVLHGVVQGPGKVPGVRKKDIILISISGGTCWSIVQIIGAR